MVHLNLVEDPRLKKTSIYARYYRFNVISGITQNRLEEWKKVSEISRMTDGRLRDTERRDKGTSCVELLYSDATLEGSCM